MTPPLVSILVWADNRADALPATLDSLLAQTHPATELVVVDNASTDATPAVLAAYLGRYPERLQVIRQEAPTSRQVAEHRHHHRLRGEFVALASAGSVSAPERLAESLDLLLTTPNLGAVCSRLATANAGPRQEAINGGDPILRRRLPREGNIVAPDTVTLRPRFLASQSFSPALAACGHLPLWLHILDDSEVLRADTAWVRETAAGDVPAPTLAEAYETVATIAAALERWRLDQYFRFQSREGTPERVLEEAAGEAQLARQLMELDRRFFGRPALGCQAAYRHALAAVARAPHCREAQEALAAVYAALGDAPRATGGPSRPLADWQDQPEGRLPPPVDESAQRAAARYRQWQGKHALRDVDGEYLGEHMVRRWHSRPAFTVVALGGGEAPSPAGLLYPPALTLAAAPGQTLGELPAAPGPAADAWLVLLPAGAALAPTALIHLADAINRMPEAQAWYADDETLPAAGGLPVPRFKPDTDPLLLLGSNYLGVLALRQSAARELGAELPLDAAAPYALALALIARHGRERLAHLPEVLFTLAPDPAASALESAALARHLAAHRPGATLVPGPAPATRRVCLPLPTPPAVSLVVIDPPGPAPHLAGLQVLLHGTAYPDLEILFCTPHPLPAAAGIRVIASAAGDTVADVINRAVQAARGDYLLVVGAGSRPASGPGWLRDAVALAAAGYGAVGIAGVDAVSGRYWGCGTVLGIGGGFDALHGTALAPGASGHLGRAAVAHEMSAVGLDGLLTHRETFFRVGGLDPQWRLPEVIASDYCLRLAQAGQRVAWTPEAALARVAASLPGAEPPLEEQLKLRDRFLSRWLPQLAADPCWNRHLSLVSADPEPEDDLVFRWNPDHRDRLRVLALPMPASGQAAYRVTSPLRALDDAGLAQVQFACEPLPGRERAPIPSELARLAPDSLYLQAAFDDVRFAGLLSAARFNPGIFRIFSLDDRVSDMPAYNAASKALPREVVVPRMREALRACHRLVVSTEPLADLYREDVDDIVVVPNRLETARWGTLQPAVNNGTRPRVGWAGALQHAGDLALIREVVAALAGEVDWVFFGMIPAGCEAFIKEFHGTVHLDAYPAKLSSLALDLALAPLEVNLFNESKSNLRLIEYGIFGWPVVCTDIDPYRSNGAPVGRLPNDPRRWIAAIRERLADRRALAAEGARLKTWVRRHYLLEDHLDEWLRALSPR